MGSSKELPAYQESGYDMPTSNEENYADQCDDLIETNLPVSYDGACAENGKEFSIRVESLILKDSRKRCICRHLILRRRRRDKWGDDNT